MQNQRLRRSAVRSLFPGRFDVDALIEDDVAKPLTGAEASVCCGRMAATRADASGRGHHRRPAAPIMLGNALTYGRDSSNKWLQ
jgi:hypothetical protein